MAISQLTPEKLQTLTVAELKKLAGRHGIELKKSLKADIVKEISKALKPKKAAPKKAAAKRPVAKKTAITAAKKAAAKKTSTNKTAKKKPVAASPAAKKKAVAKKKPSDKKKPIAPKAPDDLSSMTMAELRAVARKNSVELRAKLKADMVKELSRSLKSRTKPAAKAPAIKPPPAKISSEKKKAPAKPQAEKAAGRAMPETSRPSARTALPVGTVPPRSPEPQGSVSAGEKPAIKGGWKPKTPLAASGDWASAIPVEPGRLFVSWDIQQGSVDNGRRIVLRVMDITDSMPLGEERAGSFIQVPVRTLSGGMFVNVTPGRTYRALIGTMGMDGDLLPLIYTDPVSTPTGFPSEGESLLEEEHFLFNTSRKKGPASSY